MQNKPYNKRKSNMILGLFLFLVSIILLLLDFKFAVKASFSRNASQFFILNVVEITTVVVFVASIIFFIRGARQKRS